MKLISSIASTLKQKLFTEDIKMSNKLINSQKYLLKNVMIVF